MIRTMEKTFILLLGFLHISIGSGLGRFITIVFLSILDPTHTMRTCHYATATALAAITWHISLVNS